MQDNAQARLETRVYRSLARLLETYDWVVAVIGGPIRIHAKRAGKDLTGRYTVQIDFTGREEGGYGAAAARKETRRRSLRHCESRKHRATRTMTRCCECDHDYEEIYYGWKCRNCDQFYPYGCAPWEEEITDPLFWLPESDEKF